MLTQEDIESISKLKLKSNDFISKFQESISKRHTVLLEKQRDEALESKLAEELKVNSELKEKYSQLNKQQKDIDKLCTKLKSNLTIRENDQARLKNAQKMFAIGKQFTGLRFDYSSQDKCKGYVKNCATKILDCFEFEEDECELKLWTSVKSASSSDWNSLITNKILDKENEICN